MSQDDRLEEMSIREDRINELSTRLKQYDYLSEEFWTDFDKLKVLLLDTIQLAHRLSFQDTASRYQNIFDALMDSVPSGYWK